MSNREKKKKIITGIVSSTALIGATAGILYTVETEKKEEEKEEEKKIKAQTIEKPLLPSPSKSNVRPNPAIYNKLASQDQTTIYLNENGQEVTTYNIDLTDENISEIRQIGFYRNGEGEIQAIKMPKTIIKVPNELPKRITSTKDMFAGATLFNQDLSRWKVSKVIKHEGFATDSQLSNN